MGNENTTENKGASLFIKGKLYDKSTDKWFDSGEDIRIDCTDMSPMKISQVRGLITALLQCDGKMQCYTNYAKPLPEFYTDNTGIINTDPKIQAELLILGKKYKKGEWIDSGEIVKVYGKKLTKSQTKQIHSIISAMLQNDDFQQYERKVETTERRDGETETECGERCTGEAVHYAIHECDKDELERKYRDDKRTLEKEFKEFLVEREKWYDELHEEFFYEEEQYHTTVSA